jgi:Na+/H+-dicarboxylate symporter
MKKLALHWKILIGMFLGVIVGLIIMAVSGEELSGAPLMVTKVLWVIGKIFISLLKMIIIPLIIATMVSGVISLGSFKSLGQMGGRTFLYYFATTALSVLTGLILVNIIDPGVGADIGNAGIIDKFKGGTKTWSDIVLSIVPSNPVSAMAKMEVLPVIFFSLLFGAAVLAVGDESGPIPKFFEGFTKVMMKMTEWVIALAPYGVFALMANVIIEFGWDSLAYLAKYMITVTIGLGIHFFITLPLISAIVGGYSPIKLFRDMSAAVLTAFSSASSSATLPLTMECLQENSGVSPKTTSFVLPIGATVNMDGTALYEAVAVVFIAQAYGIDLSVGQMLIIFVTATIAAIGAAAIPSAGLFTMAIVLKAVGLPLEGVALILGVDRVLDMMRTATNVWGDSVGTIVIANLNGEELNKED